MAWGAGVANDSFGTSDALNESFATWAAYFLVVELSWGVPWTVELWSGAIVLAAASAAALVVLTRRPEPSSVG